MPARCPTSAMLVSQLPRWPAATLSVSCDCAIGEDMPTTSNAAPQNSLILVIESSSLGCRAVHAPVACCSLYCGLGTPRAAQCGVRSRDTSSRPDQPAGTACRNASSSSATPSVVHWVDFGTMPSKDLSFTWGT